jgi:5-(hydroxymethyl)furfural/furfural oxidase
MDHPSIAVASFIKPHARINDFTRRHILVGLRYSSGLEGVPQGDMFVAASSKSSWHAVGEQIASMVIFVNKTYSETGQVKLQTADWRDEPTVEFNLLSDERDLIRLKDSVHRMAAIHATPAMQAATSDPFPASYSDKVRQVGEVTSKNKFLTSVMAKLLDGPDPLRRLLMNKLILEDFTLPQLLEDDQAMEAFVRQAAVGVWHASCSCRMGTDDDARAVTNNAGRVRGVEGLRVCDASVFPVVPCANTNIPTLMTAEKIADAILEGH